ncbi:hypothetical protein FCM35_KLT03664 [Carex littledalei]|uniref:Late embryogenesis abundant protein LEA-2 subgroup domain-containing protein n=1 Tax=Carex littledalei TaxID=544730 RepID=A0A833QPQ9_9POAL|nr:hypothetical protein FCM35_KLT03664 [Carex littledalei]
MPHRSYAERARRTSCFIWTAAIFCATLATAVILAGLVVLIIYFIYQPKSPYLKMGDAKLLRLDYDQSGTLSTQLQITIFAVNDNIKTNAAFYNLRLHLLFQNVEIAELQAAPFVVPKNNSIPLGYDVQSTPIPLDSGSMSAVDSALKNREIPFFLTGKARTRWRLGSLYSVGLWAHLSCQMKFFWPNGSTVSMECNSGG